MKKLNLSIGIPAYNEEANIKNLLLNLLEQKQTNFMLKEIIVVSDASTDNTEKEITSLKKRIIKIISHKKRQGQAISQNEILEIYSGDVIVLLNADVMPSNKLFLENIIKPFAKEKNIGIVGAKVTPTQATNYFETIINFSVSMKQHLYESINHGKNIYLCHGRVRAFSKSFAKVFRWKPVTSEDAYSYFACIKNGFDFVYEPTAEVLYASPKNIHDHISQSARFLQSQEKLQKYFDKDMMNKAYTIPMNLQIITAVKFFIKDPLYFVSYISILFLSKIIAWKFFASNAVWNPSQSSKKLILQK